MFRSRLDAGVGRLRASLVSEEAQTVTLLFAVILFFAKKLKRFRRGEVSRELSIIQVL